MYNIGTMPTLEVVQIAEKEGPFDAGNTATQEQQKEKFCEALRQVQVQFFDGIHMQLLPRFDKYGFPKDISILHLDNTDS